MFLYLVHDFSRVRMAAPHRNDGELALHFKRRFCVVEVDTEGEVKYIRGDYQTYCDFKNQCNGEDRALLRQLGQGNGHEDIVVSHHWGPFYRAKGPKDNTAKLEKHDCAGLLTWNGHGYELHTKAKGHRWADFERLRTRLNRVVAARARQPYNALLAEGGAHRTFNART